jgi:hypothetical protein
MHPSPARLGRNPHVHHAPGPARGGSPRASWAWPLAWPSSSGPPDLRRLRTQGWVPKMLAAERLEKIFGCPCGWRGRPGQCAAFRPGDCDILPAIGRTWRAGPDGLPAAGARGTGRYGGDRTRPVTGEPGAAAAAPVGLPPGRPRAKLPPRNAESLGKPQPPTAGHPGRITFPGCSRPSLAVHARPSGPARRRCGPCRSVSRPRSCQATRVTCVPRLADCKAATHAEMSVACAGCSASASGGSSEGPAHAAPGIPLWGQDEGRCVCERWQKPPSRKLRVDVDLSSTSPARSSTQGSAEAV